MRNNRVPTRRVTGKPSNSIKPALLTLAITQALALQTAMAASIEVTSNLDDGTDCTLREAIDTVNAGVNQNNGCFINGGLGMADVISFGAGVAGSTIVTNGELTLTQNVKINSGGVATTIDANGVGRVMVVDGSTLELDQLTLTGGNSTRLGGGIYARYSTVTLTNSTVSGNSAGSGGGIFARGDRLSVTNFTLINSTVSGNSAGDDGGGIGTYQSLVTLMNSTVSGNSAGSSGGGIDDYRSSFTLMNSTVSGNTATGNGGGIDSVEAYITLTNSTVVVNTATDNGGGIRAFKGSVTFTNSTVSGNSAGFGGGGMFADYNSGFMLTNSTVSGNTATFNGGGIFAGDEASVRISDSTVSGNSASNGGGIFANGAGFRPLLTLTNSTVSGNTATINSGGIYAVSSDVTLSNSTVSNNTATINSGGIYAADSTVVLSNSIVANSSAADCSYTFSTVTATADSIIEDGSCGTTAMAVDPLLGPLADNGGPTQTHALLAGSPAIDNGTGPGATATDQRGVTAVGVRDSGAYEFTAAMNALTIEKLINHRVRETPGEAAQLLAGTRYRASYKVTNNSPKRIYSVRVFESGQFVCNLYSLDPGESKQPYRCASLQAVLVGDNNVPARVTAKVSGSDEELASQTNAYYTGHSNVAGKLNVTHYINEINADTKASAVNVNSNEAVVKFRVENTGPIELYRVRLYHDPASPINSGWQELCYKGTLIPGEVRYCKRPISITHTGLNKAFGRAQGLNANISATGYVNAVNPTYFNVVLP